MLREIAVYIVEISPGCWLAPWRGDPGRTLVKDNAKLFLTEHGAKTALGIARKRFPFRNGLKAAKVYHATIN